MEQLNRIEVSKSVYQLFTFLSHFDVLFLMNNYITPTPLNMVEYSKTEFPWLQMATSDKQPADQNF